MNNWINKSIKEVVQSIKEDRLTIIKCPKCKSTMIYKLSWDCIDCKFSTKEIPSREEIIKLMELKENIEKIKKWRI